MRKVLDKENPVKVQMAKAHICTIVRSWALVPLSLLVGYLSTVSPRSHSFNLLSLNSTQEIKSNYFTEPISHGTLPLG
jgi:hypothetical protein